MYVDRILINLGKNDLEIPTLGISTKQFPNLGYYLKINLKYYLKITIFQDVLF